MAELLTMIALAANVIAASAFARFASIIATGAATAHEQSSDVDTFEGRVAARIRIRNRRSEASREVGEFTRAVIAEIPVRRELIAAMLIVLVGCHPVLAQVGVVGSPTPGMGATSPLGITPGLPVPPAGIPFGATELALPGVSPAPFDTTGMPGTGTSCSSSGTSGSTTNYDGGGMTMGTGTCGSGSGNSAPSMTATSPASPGGASKAGIPLGSVELGNAGISPLILPPGQ